MERLGIWYSKAPLDYGPPVVGSVPARPMTGFLTIFGCFVYRARGLEKDTVCGRTVTDAISGAGAMSCPRCIANVAKWRQRAPHLAR